ncbi:ribosome maturation factor RimP [Marinicrinis lubricantis]|uniref:Ribosome maturation factor RimP n=1 Tax=Marinicrinis lubricantis TaxID=2086470 RepID=A0ABW1IMB2_9BACL
MGQQTIKAKVEQMVQPFLEEHGFELVDIEYVKEGANRFLRIFVDKEDGIDIEDCGRISEFMSAKLDEEDPIPDAYFLEVSSPGAERPLKKPRDFERSIGKYVLVTTYEPIDGQKEFEGTLTAYQADEHLVVKVGKKDIQIPLDKVGNARLAIQF